MSDMKVRIIIEDGDGQTRTATLSFEEETVKALSRKPKKPALLSRLMGMGFIVRETIPLLEPGMVGELHVEKLDMSRDRCLECDGPMWVMLEVVEDNEPFVTEHPFINVDHDLIGEFCFACGYVSLNEEIGGRGVFGLMDEEKHLTLQEFLDDIEGDEPDIGIRARFLRVLIRQEHLHMKAVYRIRQKLAQLRVNRREAEVVGLGGAGEVKE